ncbi:MAG: hypothetical protein IKN42_05245 [Elusimicrobia bacterium]|nr:hypothetical protein [Elusimicrobiota bacterium]
MIKILKSNLFFFILLFLVVFIVYGKTINFGITNLDDDTLVTRNIDYLSNIKNIPKLFLTDCYLIKGTQYYRPILSLSFAIETILLKNNLKIYHTTNILLFVLSLISIFIFLSKLKFSESVLKFFILLFAVHPILSSVPVWIPARNDSLLIILFILSLINFINYLNTDKKKYLFSFLFFFSLSLFTKETTIFMTLIYPVLCYCFNIKFTKKQFINILFSVLFIFVVYFFLRYFSVIHTDTKLYITNWLYYLKNILFGFMIYIEKIFYPQYIPVMLYDIKLNILTYTINIIFFVLLIIYTAFSKQEKKKTVLFALLFSLLAFFPTFLTKEYVFLSHRLITGLIGILIILTVIFENLTIKYPKIKKYLVVLFLFVFSLFCFYSFKQSEKYRDSFTYWYNAYKDAPTYYVTPNGLATEYMNIKDFEKAKKLSLEAINLNKNIDNCITYAKILFSIGERELSKQIFYQLLELDKKQSLIYTNLYNIYLFENNIKDSLECAEKAVFYSSSIIDKIPALENLSKIYAISGNYKDSMQILFDLLEYNKKANYYFNISLLFEDLNDYDNSIVYIRKALKIEPDNKDYLNQLKNIESKLLTK